MKDTEAYKQGALARQAHVSPSSSDMDGECPYPSGDQEEMMDWQQGWLDAGRNLRSNESERHGLIDEVLQGKTGTRLKVTLLSRPERKIAAIKVIKLHQNLGLRDAKRAVERPLPNLIGSFSPREAADVGAALRATGAKVHVENPLEKLAAVADEFPDTVVVATVCPWLTHAVLSAARQLWKDADEDWKKDADVLVSALVRDMDAGAGCLCGGRHDV